MTAILHYSILIFHSPTPHHLISPARFIHSALFTAMHIRNRILALKNIPARELRPNPRNWRLHPPAQQDALRGLLAEIGFAGALVARQLADGGLELIDGHLRAETTPDMAVPVLVLDVDEAEAALLLATFDPLTLLATADDARLAALLDEVHSPHPAIQALLDSARTEPATNDPPPLSSAPPPLNETFQLLVDLPTEAAQRDLYERLTGEGLRCRVLTL